ncbi:Spy/CpxP family protein refolding chaperone [Arsukibacterium sp.]|uniref:Spy/CpxP family protein refolding chaperone n=1 Tax=Arsukibacterium sp. TaxID=1977258 RepID=UPI00299E41D1|nr:Spy/CpxP family protein refolding chaperone [Arsukibacterium sp.]MDX1676668.1 Spy/CpxP family protein refolding chaperone [Arsukibacterium sp.]
MMKAITLMLATAGLLLATANAGHHSKAEQADQPYKMQQGRSSYQKMLAGLELNRSQQQQLRQLLKAHKVSKPERADREQMRGTLRQLIQADYFDEAAVTGVLQKQQQQQMEYRLARLKLRHQVYQLLTPEQRQQLATWQQKRKLNWQQKPKMHSEQ